ncbi:MAG: hypothetical protein QOJ59_973, partial [Thermomicrobiales bacterium]|nr:hypothetical protein [Thermomicrobiales bacterium]
RPPQGTRSQTANVKDRSCNTPDNRPNTGDEPIETRQRACGPPGRPVQHPGGRRCSPFPAAPSPYAAVPPLLASPVPCWRGGRLPLLQPCRRSVLSPATVVRPARPAVATPRTSSSHRSRPPTPTAPTPAAIVGSQRRAPCHVGPGSPSSALRIDLAGSSSTGGELRWHASSVRRLPRGGNGPDRQRFAMKNGPRRRLGPSRCMAPIGKAPSPWLAFRS